MARLVVLVCDECEAQEQVKHYEIKQGERRSSVDLCEAHSEVLDLLLAKGTAVALGVRQSRHRPRKITRMDEIEALKERS